ncbi:unnamed protein product [Brassicogethes aeneus]|uniref:C2H2-type domain-containing protein n=1 Tax=Brassicogethes aeneus TaxID=1431903 RepID=A0A9P0ASE5_BRAAE|nr:unnamed protein product [Brassicogethes aeneus]
MEHVHILKKLDCAFCGKHFHNEKAYRAHLKKYDLKIYKLYSAPKQKVKVPCHICGKMVLKRSLVDHVKLHTNEKAYSCPVCEESFKTQGHLRAHRISKHEPKEMCEICGAQIKRNHIRRHLLKHGDIRKYKCTTCDKSFKTVSALQQHKLIHENFARHRCDICAKPFKRADNLRVHKRSHADVKPFPCDLCTKTFTTKQWRDSHRRSHF